MKTATATLKSISTYGQGKFYEVDKLNKESSGDYEKRTWRERLHCDDSGEVFIPPMVFKNCLAAAAKRTGMQIPGKGKATYTKHFVSGVLVVEPLMLGIMRDDVHGEWRFLPSQPGIPKSPRVKKCMPEIREWSGDVEFQILDDTITKDVFEHVLKEAGKFVGIGVFRPENGGYHGRFVVEKIKWE